MRVIAGKHGGRKLRTLRGLALRPTSDALRETLFNILGSMAVESIFIDVFAGSGAVGLEALSRGASEVFFIEKHAPAAEVIRQNLSSLGIASGAEVISADALRGLEILAARHLLADLIYLDPPYEKEGEYLRVLEFLDASRLVAPRGWVIAEHTRRRELPDRFEHLERVRLHEQGDASLSFYHLALAA
ncbi:MAG: 16S rRNA (guanine(966)-N(2))-methyltransferase RsmD [Candidatus Acidiferrales bacterium]